MARPSPIPGLGPETRLADAARRILSSRVADVRQYEDALDHRVTEDDVHDMRVATRRLRAPLKLFRELGALRPLERDVKRLQDALGAVRDVHVQRLWLIEAARQQKPKDRARFAALRAYVERELEEHEQHLQRALHRWSEGTVPALVREVGQVAGRGKYGGRGVREHLSGRLRKVRRYMKRYMRAPDGLVAHQLRKEVKKLRYEAELLGPALPRLIDALLEVLAPLQEVLGALHDADVRVQLLEECATEGAPAERAAALSLLEHVREERTRRAADVARELQRWRAESLARSLDRMVSTRRRGGPSR